MINQIKSSPLLILLILIVSGCIDPYSPSVSRDQIEILVIDGFINATDQSATVKLSRTITLSSDNVFPKEREALVSILNEAGESTKLPETDAGIYKAQNLTLSTSVRYKLHVETKDRNIYESDFITLTQAPHLDSITWSTDSKGLTIYVNAHAANENTRYYQWDYQETWEYTSVFNSNLKHVGDLVVNRPPEESIYFCWNNQPASSILIGSTVRLTHDVISNFPLTFIPSGSVKTSRKYSILVQQKALTQEAYQFWSQLQKTTENLGGLFDPLPSQVLGNFQNIQNVTEPVLGYFSGGTVQQQRIYINYTDLPSYLRTFRHPQCELDTIYPSGFYVYGKPSLFISWVDIPTGPILTSTNECIDCRTSGGSTTKPDFWP